MGNVHPEGIAAVRIRTADIAKTHLAKGGRFMIRTFGGEAGSTYQMENGAGIPRHVAESLQADRLIMPCEDGLFPGFSQTWRLCTDT